MDLLGQSSILVGASSFTLGFSVLARNPRNKLYIAFFGVALLLSAWAVSFYMERVWPDGLFYRFHLLFNVWIGPAALILMKWMVRVDDRFSRRLLETSVVAAVILSVALAVELDRAPRLVGVLQPAVFFCPTFAIVQILYLVWRDRRASASTISRPLGSTGAPGAGGGRRQNLIYFGALGVFCLSVMDHVPMMGTILPAIGNLALTVYLFFVSQAITQQRLLNLGAQVSRFFVLLVVALIITVFYLLLVGWIQESPGLFFLNSFLASFMLLSLLDPIRSLVTSFSGRLLTQKHLRLQGILRAAQRRLTGVVEPSTLYSEILRTAQETLVPSWAAVFVLASDGTRFVRVSTLGKEPLPSPGALPAALRELIADHPLIQYCARQRARREVAVILDAVLESEAERSATRSQREFFVGLRESLAALGGNILFPLVDEQEGGPRVLGFVLAQASAPPESWGPSWGLLSVIAPFFDQAGQNLRSMEVFVRSREKERLAELGEMSAGLAHEIRNPLGAIKGAAQFLDPSQDRPESRFLRVIVEEVDRLNRVVTQFLDYSKPGSADFRLIDPAALARRTVDFQKSGMPPGVLLEFIGPPTAPYILGSSEQLSQVLINLIQNSVRALESRNDGFIRVSLEEGAARGRQHVLIQVEDNGCGIAPGHLDKIFIPFFTTSPSGTGLGLPISQKIVEAHRGRLEVSSELGRYTRFTVSLPTTAERG